MFASDLKICWPFFVKNMKTFSNSDIVPTQKKESNVPMQPNGGNVWILVNANFTEAAAPPTVGEEQRQRMQPWLKVIAPRKKKASKLSITWAMAQGRGWLGWWTHSQ